MMVTQWWRRDKKLVQLSERLEADLQQPAAFVSEREVLIYDLNQEALEILQLPNDQLASVPNLLKELRGKLRQARIYPREIGVSWNDMKRMRSVAAQPCMAPSPRSVPTPVFTWAPSRGRRHRAAHA